MDIKTEPTFRADIWIAGDLDTIRRTCREYTLAIGLCVTIEPCEFVYTGGLETGARVGLLNYPRFPKTPADVSASARALALTLIESCCQTSVLIADDEKTEWISRRGDLPAVKGG
jgi:hypothetical protein